MTYQKAHARKRAFFSKYLASLSDATISKVVLNTLASGLQPLALENSALEKLIADSQRCSKKARQEMVITRNAPSLLGKSILIWRPICTIYQKVLKRPRSASVSVWDVRADDVAVKLVVTGDTSPSVPTSNNHKVNKRFKGLRVRVATMQCVRNAYFSPELRQVLVLQR